MQELSIGSNEPSSGYWLLRRKLLNNMCTFNQRTLSVNVVITVRAWRACVLVWCEETGSQTVTLQRHTCKAVLRCAN